jgi:hypothetical protein
MRSGSVGKERRVSRSGATRCIPTRSSGDGGARRGLRAGEHLMGKIVRERSGVVHSMYKVMCRTSRKLIHRRWR